MIPPFVAACVLLGGCASASSGGLEGIDTIVVIYAENRSFDHLYGLFPGAEGIAQATAEQKTQIDLDGKPLPHLPSGYVRRKPDPRLPEGLPNGPFQIDAPPVNGRWDELLPSPTHVFNRNKEQINGGKNNAFVAMSDVGAWVMSYYDGSHMKLWSWARRYTLSDHFFMGAYGGSYLNHQWLVCACTPRAHDFPPSLRPRLDDAGRLVKRPESPASVLQGPVQVLDGLVSSDGYTVNSMQPPYQPSGIPPAPGGDARLAGPAPDRLAPSGDKTIGDTLSGAGVSWAWYSQGWREALEDGPRDRKTRRVIYSEKPGSVNFQPHHQPFNYYLRFAPGTRERALHLKDYDDLIEDIRRGTLPRVAFYKPAGVYNEHPGSSTLAEGDDHIAALLERLESSPQWPHMAVIVTYDENGGFWDHVPPPAGDRWGPGSRIPTIIVSPYAKRGYVDKTPYDTTSILKFITRRFGLEPLPGVRANAGDLSNAFLFD